MTDLAKEWELKTSNGITYTIEIKDFINQTKPFSVGKPVSSEVFKIGEFSFKILMYPKGYNKKSANSLSVFLSNESDWEVKASFTFIINEHSLSQENDLIFNSKKSKRGSNKWGWDPFVHRSRCHKGDLLEEDGTLTLVAKVKLLGEEVSNKRSALGNHLPTELDQQQKKKVTDLKQEMKKITAALNNLTASQSVEMHCPICMEPAKRPMRLMQCGQGHIICDACFKKAKAEAVAQRRAGASERLGNPHIDLCHTCR